jgi:nitroreductase
LVTVSLDSLFRDSKKEFRVPGSEPERASCVVPWASPCSMTTHIPELRTRNSELGTLLKVRMPDYPVLKPILDRRSVRKFDAKPVEREKILACVEAARLAPSAENIQPWRFVILDDPSDKNRFGEAAFSGIYKPTRWALNAPVLVVLLAELNVVAHGLGRWIQGTQYHLLDMGISGEHFVLQAQSLGLGTCWIGWFNARKAHQILKLPPKVRVCQLLAVGYPASGFKPRPPRRKPLGEIVFFNKWK